MRLMHPRPGARLLDVGCGTGDDVVQMATAVAPRGRVVGVDLRAAMVGRVREKSVRTPAVDFVVADGHDLPFLDDYFDATRTDRTLQHVEEPRTVLAGNVARGAHGGGLSYPTGRLSFLIIPYVTPPPAPATTCAMSASVTVE